MLRRKAAFDQRNKVKHRAEGSGPQGDPEHTLFAPNDGQDAVKQPERIQGKRYSKP
jgi:hypothetical protein